ncbi:hypothetical protein TVAG_307150 [Trichomonas vaginalis G3]|uniref:Thioredoxin domain-containing protein n=1 Tax=Trichomonas vaginalis (strain ATCC PRA-98 / G3) TaxID=412133 RepID=A2FMB9_TRIV3|nr:thioredoxin-like family [Trichomonas vaginalis G3]EAX93936.1 hypothetical protein TVAG_307150 [Trichomonas vaginalis G3]KAI5549071.1 thioredoxin-like family [Trichomonas vaginalis G3]|eukprot:XP_001306866.1 hypothetical protein [Trichomonas vaginalis G3]
MLSLLFSFSLSGQFVPFVPEETMMLFNLNLTEIAKLVQEAPRVVVYLHDNGVTECFQYRTKLADAIRLFPDLVFIQLDVKDAEGIIEQLNITAPHLLFYNKGDLWSHCIFPASETALLYLLNLFEEGERLPVSSTTEFLKALGTSHYTLLYPKDEKNKSTHAHRFATTVIGFIDLLPFTKELADEMGLNYSQMYLFRLEDVALIPVEDNITEIIEATIPDYSRISPEMLTSDLSLVVGAVVNRVTPSVVDYLERVSEAKIEGVKVGFFDRALHEVVNISNGQTISEFPTVVTFQSIVREYYEVPEEINTELRNGNTKNAAELTINFLNNLPEAKKPTEAVPTEQTGLIKKLVGSTHDKFVATEGKDVMVLYISPDSIQTRDYMRIFREAAEIIVEKGHGDKFEFGIINTTLNAAENYPTMIALPHIQVYPVNKANNNSFYAQPTKEDILRFVKRNCGSEYDDIEVPEATRNENSLEIVQIYAFLRSLDEDARRKADDRLRELLPSINMTLEQMNAAVFGNQTQTE